MDKHIRSAIEKYKEIETAVLNERDAGDSTDAVIAQVVQLYIVEYQCDQLRAVADAIDRSGAHI